jgi:hypothetical protein
MWSPKADESEKEPEEEAGLKFDGVEKSAAVRGQDFSAHAPANKASAMYARIFGQN